MYVLLLLCILHRLFFWSQFGNSSFESNNNYTMASKKETVNFKLLSFNVRGIRSLEKRKALSIWLNKQKADIIFLQETYSSVEIENIWRTQWNGKMFFTHGSNHSCGVITLVRNDLDFEEESCKCDQNGRFIILNASVQGVKYVFANIYAPNKVRHQLNVLTLKIYMKNWTTS